MGWLHLLLGLVVIGAEPLSCRLNGDFSYVHVYMCVSIRPSVNCLNKRSCGLRHSNVLHFPSCYTQQCIMVGCVYY